MKPRIGITSGLESPGWREDGPTWRSYASAVERAGGLPVHLDPRSLGRERAVLAELGGILFSGGQDIDLSMYPNPPPLRDEEPRAVMARYRMRPEPDRDRYELPLLQEALQRDLPILGICRGCQVLNVGLGGRLVLDIPLELGEPLQHGAGPPPERLGARHPLRIAPETLLASILDPEQFRECNSRHHQSVRLDESFSARLAAVCPEDGVVEAIEVPGRRWAVGVQWHPEHPTDPGIREQYAPLFRAFVDACA